MNFDLLLQKYKKKLIAKNEVLYITIDGITCSGKTTFTKSFGLDLRKKYNILIISKDLFLKPRNKRILITKEYNNYNKTQNQLHYDLRKLELLLNFFKRGNLDKKIILTNLYNRKNGKNNLKLKFLLKKNMIILLEGLYVNDDLKNITKPILKILIVENIYKSLVKKIERIRDKKISIDFVIKEFMKIHLISFRNYLHRNEFNLFFQPCEGKFKQLFFGKKLQTKLIEKFILKHNL
jgi:uridine kinase